jgi:hypothetical protein
LIALPHSGDCFLFKPYHFGRCVPVPSFAFLRLQNAKLTRLYPLLEFFPCLLKVDVAHSTIQHRLKDNALIPNSGALEYVTAGIGHRLLSDPFGLMRASWSVVAGFRNHSIRLIPILCRQFAVALENRCRLKQLFLVAGSVGGDLGRPGTFHTEGLQVL